MSAIQAMFRRNGSASVTATGADETDAAALTKQYNSVAGADDAKGVILPAPKSGEDLRPVLVYNEEAATGLLVYPHSGATIDEEVADAPVTVGPTTMVIFWPVSSTAWRGYSPPASVASGVTPGTVAASKAVVVDANKDIATFRDVGGRDFAGRNFDAGASGTAGTVDVFPATAAKGKLAITKADNTNNDTTTFTFAEMGQATTVTVPDPGGATASTVLTEGAQTINGLKTFASLVAPAVARTATADGLTTGTIADAGSLQFVTVTVDDAAKIIVLPTPTPGSIVLLVNGGTGYELRSSAPETVAINGGTGAGAESAIAADTLVVAVCKSATEWAAWSLVGTTLAAVEAAA